jgi:hypothetical protein
VKRKEMNLLVSVKMEIHLEESEPDLATDIEEN